MRASPGVTTLAKKEIFPFFDQDRQCENCRRPPCPSLRSSKRAACRAPKKRSPPSIACKYVGAHRRRTARSAASALPRIRRRNGRASDGPRRSRRRRVRFVLRSSAGARSRHAQSGRHVSRVAAAPGRAHRPSVCGKRIRRVASDAPARQDGRSRPLVRASRLSQRLGDHVAVGGPRRVHEAQRLRDDARAARASRWSTAATTRRTCTARCARTR